MTKNGLAYGDGELCACARGVTSRVYGKWAHTDNRVGGGGGVREDGGGRCTGRNTGEKKKCKKKKVAATDGFTPRRWCDGANRLRSSATANRNVLRTTNVRTAARYQAKPVFVRTDTEQHTAGPRGMTSRATTRHIDCSAAIPHDALSIPSC